MSSTAKILVTLAIIAAAVVAIWFGLFRRTGPAPEVAPTPVLETTPANTNPSSFFKRPGTRGRATNVAGAEVSGVDTNLITDWEDRVDQILGNDDLDAEEKGKKMLELLPYFPEAGQADTAEHISNLLADEDYEKFGNFLTNSKTSAKLQDVILADVLNRPNEIKLPLLLETARNPDNAKAAEAKETLELYLEEDYGTDWDKWQQEVGKWLKDNPD